MSKYETFCDEAFYGMWAVRPVGEKRWGYCYHLPSKEEAEGLAKELDELTALRAEKDKATGELQRRISQLNEIRNRVVDERDALRAKVAELERIMGNMADPCFRYSEGDQTKELLGRIAEARAAIDAAKGDTK